MFVHHSYIVACGAGALHTIQGENCALCFTIHKYIQSPSKYLKLTAFSIGCNVFDVIKVHVAMERCTTIFRSSESSR